MHVRESRDTHQGPDCLGLLQCDARQQLGGGTGADAGHHDHLASGRGKGKGARVAMASGLGAEREPPAKAHPVHTWYAGLRNVLGLRLILRAHVLPPRPPLSM